MATEFSGQGLRNLQLSGKQLLSIFLIKMQIVGLRPIRWNRFAGHVIKTRQPIAIT